MCVFETNKELLISVKIEKKGNVEQFIFSAAVVRGCILACVAAMHTPSLVFHTQDALFWGVLEGTARHRGVHGAIVTYPY